MLGPLSFPHYARLSQVLVAKFVSMDIKSDQGFEVMFLLHKIQRRQCNVYATSLTRCRRSQAGRGASSFRISVASRQD